MVQERLSVWLCYKQKQVSATVCLGVDNSGCKIPRNSPSWKLALDPRDGYGISRGVIFPRKHRLLGKADLILWIGFRVNFEEELAV